MHDIPLLLDRVVREHHADHHRRAELSRLRREARRAGADQR
jgi:hypothetical protein